MQVVEIGSSRIAVLPVVRGLTSEEERVEDAFRVWNPGLVVLSISKEEVESLKVLRDDEFPPESYEERAYMVNLSRFGEVKKPPPCFQKAVNLCTEMDVDCVGADMTEEEYTDAYCYFISTLEVMRESWFKRSLDSKTLRAESPSEFVLKFDSIVNKSRGHRELERERERVIAHKLWKLAKREDRILAIIELERADGVISELRKKRR
ncbi:MAG: hypothetical protein ACE5KV_00260 [Thermoplasmata archaeon]